MATYTDNYQLTLPGYADVADVADLNHNATIIDEIMHSSQISLADAYDSTQTYNAGDVVMYNYKMYKCLTDGVTGTWDPTKWERTTAAQTGGNSDPDYYGTASGDPASFADGAAAGLVKCETNLEPVQDLHGYDKPWAGGAGKNKYIGSPSFEGYANITTYQVSGETYQGHEVIYKSTPWQGVYKANIPLNAGITYTFSVMVKTSTTANVRIFMDASTLLATADVGTTWQRVSAQITPSTDIADARIRIESVTGDITIYLSEYMLEEGSYATTYEPYSNICPISGHSSVTINVSPTSDPSQGLNVIIQLGNTYYGGILNVLTGELTVTHVCKTLTTADLNISYVSAASDANSYYYNLTNAFSSGEIVNDASGRSNIFKWYRNLYSDRTIEGITGQGAYVSVRVNSSRVADTSPDALKAYLPATWQVYAKLNTFQTVQLTPQEVNSLLGQNYVSSDTGAVDVIYIKTAAPIIPNATGDSSGDLNSIGLGGKIFIIPKELPAPPAADGAYKLRITVTDGAPTFSWVSDT